MLLRTILSNTRSATFCGVNLVIKSSAVMSIADDFCTSADIGFFFGCGAPIPINGVAP